MVVLLAGGPRLCQTVLELAGAFAGRDANWIAVWLNAENRDFLVDQSTGGMKKVDSVGSDWRGRDG